MEAESLADIRASYYDPWPQATEAGSEAKFKGASNEI
jgi:hypothetical protein